MRSTVFIRRAAVFCALQTAAVVLGQDVPLTFFTGIDCKTPSATAPTVSLPLQVCAVTQGLKSFHFGDAIACSGGGTVKHILFTDTACAEIASVLDWTIVGSDDDCYSAFDEGTINAVMMTCNGAADAGDDAEDKYPGAPVSTTTIAVGPVNTSSSFPLSTPSSNPSVLSQWLGLPLGVRIAVIVVAAVMVSILIGSCLWHYRRKSKKTVHNLGTGQQPPHGRSPVQQDRPQVRQGWHQPHQSQQPQHNEPLPPPQDQPPSQQQQQQYQPPSSQPGYTQTQQQKQTYNEFTPIHSLPQDHEPEETLKHHVEAFYQQIRGSFDDDVIMVAALYYPDLGIVVASKPRSPETATAVTEDGAYCPAWALKVAARTYRGTLLASQDANLHDKYHAEDHAVALAARLASQTPGIDFAGGFPRGTRIVAYGKKVHDDAVGLKSPCAEGYTFVSPSCQDVLRALGIRPIFCDPANVPAPRR